MQKLAIPLMSLVLMAGVASAQQSSPSMPATKSEKATTSRSHSNRMKAEVVSTDPVAKTITLKTDSGEKTMKVEGRRTVRRLKSLKAGEEVWVTSREHSGADVVVSLKPVRTHAASTHTASASKSAHHAAAVKY